MVCLLAILHGTDHNVNADRIYEYRGHDDQYGPQPEEFARVNPTLLGAEGKCNEEAHDREQVQLELDLITKVLK